MGNVVMFREESTQGTFLAPTEAHSGMISFTPVTGEVRIDRNEIGRSEMLVAQHQGSQLPTATLVSTIEPSLANNILFLESLGLPVAASAEVTTGVYDHAILLDADTDPPGISWQSQLGLYGTTTTINGRGFEVNSIELSASVDAAVQMTVNMLGQEVTKAGEDFSNGNTSAAAVSVSFPALTQELLFDGVTVNAGGTASLSSSLISLADDAAVTVEALTLTITRNKTQRQVLGSRFNSLITPGMFDITGSLTVLNDPPALTWWDKLLGNTQEPLQILITGEIITGAYLYELEITLPLVAYQETQAFGAPENVRNPRTLSIPFRAVEDATLAHGVGIRIRNATASY